MKTMSGTTWRIITTVIKEFWLPFVLAVGFALWGVSGEQFRAVQGYFFGFLMLAWFTGQIVRIKREIERKDSAKATIDRLTTLSEKLDSQFEMIVGHATGGTRTLPSTRLSMAPAVILRLPLPLKASFPYGALT